MKLKSLKLALALCFAALDANDVAPDGLPWRADCGGSGYVSGGRNGN